MTITKTKPDEASVPLFRNDHPSGFFVFCTGIQAPENLLFRLEAVTCPLRFKIVNPQSVNIAHRQTARRTWRQILAMIAVRRFRAVRLLLGNRRRIFLLLKQ